MNIIDKIMHKLGYEKIQPKTTDWIDGFNYGLSHYAEPTDEDRMSWNMVKVRNRIIKELGGEFAE